MKHFLSIVLVLILSLSLAACTGDDNQDTSNAQLTSQQQNTPESTNDNRGMPAGADAEIGQGIYYYELYELMGDSGDGTTPREGADLVVTDLLAPMGFFDELNHPQCVYISFEDMLVLDGAMGHECYIYSVAFGTSDGGLMGDNYEVVYTVAVDYGEWRAFIYDDFGSSGQNGSSTDDTGIPAWQGVYMGDGFSIDIVNFNGSKFNFSISNLRNGKTIFDGVAVLNPDNDHYAFYMDVGFSLYEDFNKIDFYASESSEWAHLRGQYERLE